MKERISWIDIRDYKATKHVRIDLKDFLLITGYNGSGKSSLIDAFLDIFAGGSDPGTIREGAKRSIVAMGLTSGVTITKTVTPKSYTVEAIGADGVPIKAPQTYINSLAEAMSIDPARLLAAKDKDIAKILLELMPISFDPMEVEKATGTRPDRALSLDDLDKSRKQLFEERSRTNVRLKQVQGSYTELYRSIPAEIDGQDWNARVASLEEQKSLLEHDCSEERSRAALDFASERMRLVDERDREIDAIKCRVDRAVGSAQDYRDEQVRKIDAAYEPRRAGLISELAVAKKNATDKTMIVERKRLAEAQQEEAAAMQSKADSLTELMAKMDKLKASKLANLPIQGVTFEDGQVFVDGFAWAHVNKTRRAEIAYQIVQLRGGQLPFILQDDAEFLDPESWKAFLGFVKENGYQIIAAKVSPGPLNIETRNLAEGQAA